MTGSADEVAIDCRILISKKLNDPVTEEIVIAIEIGIVKGDDRGATIASATEIVVSEISATETVIAETERSGAIVRMRTRRKFALRKSPWMVRLDSDYNFHKKYIENKTYDIDFFFLTF